ncbi:MAG: hypothetical protein COX81_03185 [Candidatus Magasanikbacteria bacterium CG_4_10_14_0_2_um_filter_37_12]|uniref:GxxExxY protein n=1 Tax=Candidatus Magasanikbacteria bacterium CG_4_10_14_0_2_um_filter_37_12 TaxID=1974637 RepID=A0A2M7V774_9BACT|nr:MAG: hypothetical protein COX81_03185 [Candidatus Magasanikbacteria bacterium CG_4_10_14_0_2_um_filter_37_12]
MVNNNYTLRRNDLLYPELSYKINGVLFGVHNAIGGNNLERYVQKAVAIGLKKVRLKFEEQYYVPIKYNDKIVGKYFLDFLIEDKVVLELKRGRFIPKNIYSQVGQYLDSLGFKLAIIGCFAQDCVVIKRIVNHNLFS